MFPSSATAYSALQKFGQTRRTPQDYLKDAETKYDIPNITTRLSRLRSLVGNLESSAESVDPSVTGRTSGSLVTEAQRSALVNRERQPILADLSKQQGAYGQEQQQFGLASDLASKMAQASVSGDETTYQSLLDQYNAATAQEQAQEAKRQFEAQMALEREKVRKSGGGGGGIDLSGILSSLMGGGGGAAATQAGSPQDEAYLDVQKRLQGSDAELRSDYAATLSSANRGNVKDKNKIALYLKSRPDLFYPKVAPNYNSRRNTTLLAGLSAIPGFSLYSGAANIYGQRKAVGKTVSSGVKKVKSFFGFK